MYLGQDDMDFSYYPDELDTIEFDNWPVEVAESISLPSYSPLPEQSTPDFWREIVQATTTLIGGAASVVGGVARAFGSSGTQAFPAAPTTLGPWPRPALPSPRPTSALLPPSVTAFLGGINQTTWLAIGGIALASVLLTSSGGRSSRRR